MGVVENKALAQRYYQAICEGRIDELESLVAQDVEWTIVGTNRSIDFQTLKGMWTAWFSTPPGPNAMKVVAMTAEGDRVAVEAEGNIKLPDGRMYSNKYHMLLVMRDGRIAKVREYLDTAYAEKFFGSQA